MRTRRFGGHREHSQEERGGERQEITVERMLGAQPAHGGCAGSQELSREVLAVVEEQDPGPALRELRVLEGWTCAAAL